MTRFFDIIFSMIAVIILTPFMIPIMIGLKLTGEHDIFYKQKRVGEGGIFWPQNAEYSRTSEIVKLIAKTNRHKMLVSKVFNPAVMLAAHIPGKISDLTNKVLGNLVYDRRMSRYDFEYQIIGLEDSIKRTE